MSKVLVERPRRGGGRCKPGRPLPLEDRPSRVPMNRYASAKSLNEHLGPLRRFLASRVGRPWDTVYAELREHVRPANAVQMHVLEHLDDYVVRHVRVVGDRLEQANGWPLEIRWRRPFYVCPRSGRLLRLGG